MVSYTLHLLFHDLDKSMSFWLVCGCLQLQQGPQSIPAAIVERPLSFLPSSDGDEPITHLCNEYFKVMNLQKSPLSALLISLEYS